MAGRPAATSLAVELPACSEDPAASWESPEQSALLKELTEIIQSLPSINLIPELPCPLRPQSSSRRITRRFARAMRVWEVATRARATILALCRPGLPSGRTSEPSPGRFRKVAEDHRTLRIWRRLASESKRVLDGRRESWQQFPTGAAVLGRVLRAELSDVYTKPTEKTNIYTIQSR